jgi:hypothetical protein
VIRYPPGGGVSSSFGRRTAVPVRAHLISGIQHVLYTVYLPEPCYCFCNGIHPSLGWCILPPRQAYRDRVRFQKTGKADLRDGCASMISGQISALDPKWAWAGPAEWQSDSGHWMRPMPARVLCREGIADGAIVCREAVKNTVFVHFSPKSHP